MPITFGVSNKPSHKGEDRHAHASEGQLHAYGVFDGHSGKAAAVGCAGEGSVDGLLQRLLKGRSSEVPLDDDDAIADSFWSIDEDLGRAGVLDGTTATVLLAEQPSQPTGPELRAVLAWAGDSAAVTVDMRQRARGRPAFVTPIHSPHVEAEVAQLRRLCDVRQRVDASPAGREMRQLMGAEDSKQVAAAAAAVSGGAEPSAAEVRLFARACHRADVIAEVLPDGAEVRRAALVQRRTVKESSHPLVVATHASHEHPFYYDLQMTRSVCDWKGSDMVLPHPQLHAFHVGATEHVRVVLASDGLWDVCTAERAARTARHYAKPQEAADSLVRWAEHVYLDTKGKSGMGDDTTVMVVDLNPAELPFEPPPQSACCALL